MNTSAHIPSMSSTANMPANLFPKALVYQSEENARSTQASPREAWLAFASTLRWKYVKDAANLEAPHTLLDFRCEECLVLDRLPTDAAWKDVEDAVRPFQGNTDGGPALCVSGRLPSRIPAVRGRKTVVIVASSDSERSDWMSTLRVRIAPWKALMEIYRTLVSSRVSSGVPVLAIASVIHDQVASKRHLINPALSAAVGSSHYNDSGSGSPVLQLADTLDSASRIPEFVESVAIIVKVLRESVPNIAETAEKVADIAKCVTVVSAAFQVVALGARLAHMVSEGARGRQILPRLHAELETLAVAASESIIAVLNPEAGIDDLRLEAIFKFQEECMQTLEGIEDQLMRSKVGQAMSSSKVSDAESKVKSFHERLVTIRNTGDIAIAKVEKKREKNQTLANVGSSGYNGDVLPMPSLSPYFVGRGKEREKLQKILQRFGSAAITQYGGAGKTQLMVSFAESARRNGLVPGGAFWVPVAGNEAQILSSVVDFAQRLGRFYLPESDRSSVGPVIAALGRALNSVEGRWVLCLDNADDEEAAEVLGEIAQLAEGECGWLIVTSRRGDPMLWPGLVEEQILKLSPLEEEDAMCVLLQFKNAESRTAKRDAAIYSALERLKYEDPEEYRALVDLGGGKEIYGLAGLPLALVQAGSFIASAGITFAEYVEVYKKQWKNEDLSSVFRKAMKLYGVREEQRAIWTTWKVNMSKLDLLSRSVLRAVAMLGDRDIPERLMKRVVMECSRDESMGESSNLPYFNTVKLELVNDASLLSMEHESGTTRHTVFKLHSMIRLCVRTDAGTERRACQDRALRAVHACVSQVLEEDGFNFNSLPGVYGETMRYLLPHAISVVKEQVQVSRRIAMEMFATKSEPLANFAIRMLLSSGRAREADDLCSIVLPLVPWEDRKLGVRELASKLVSALTCVRTIEETKRRQDREKWLNYILFRSYARYDIGEFRDSESDARNALHKIQSEGQKWRTLSAVCIPRQFRQRENGPSFYPESSMCANLLHQLARIKAIEGVLDEAEQLYRESLRMHRAVHGEDAVHPSIAVSLHTLGGVMKGKGVLDEAEQLCRESLRMKRAVHGEDAVHPSIAVSLHNLGGVMKGKGVLDEAEQLYRESLRMHRAVHGEDAVHPEIAASLNQLGGVMESKGVLDEAEQLYRESLGMKRAVHGEDAVHPSIAVSLHKLGGVMKGKGVLDEAEQLYRESLRMHRAVHGEDAVHPEIAASLNQLGAVMESKGVLDEAEQLFRESLGMKRAVHGEDAVHPSIAVSLHNLGGVMKGKGVLDEAEQLYRESLRMHRAVHGEDAVHPEIAASLNQLGAVMESKGVLDEAEQLYRESLGMKRAVHGEDAVHPSIAVSLHKLGGVMKGKGVLDEAEQLYRESLRMHRAVHGEDAVHPEIAASLNQLGAVMESKGVLDEAEQLYRESLRMNRAVHGEDAVHPSIAVSLHNLGGVMKGEGVLDEAEQLYRESLRMHRALHGEDAVHPEIAASLNQLGAVMESKGVLDEAEQLYRESLGMKRAVHGEDAVHPSIAVSLHKLGGVMKGKVVLDEAEQLYRESLRMHRAVHGEDAVHPEIAASLNQLGAVMESKGVLDEAEQLYRESLGMKRAVHGEDAVHPSIAVSLHKLGGVMKGKGVLDEAEEFYRESLRMNRAVHGEDAVHPSIAVSLHNLGGVMKGKGVLDEAEQLYRESLRMKRAVHGEDAVHPSIAVSLHNLGGVMKGKGVLDEAEQLYRESLRMNRAVHGEDAVHPSIAVSLHNLGGVMKGKGVLDEAEQLYRESLRMHRALHGEDAVHPEIAASLNQLGAVMESKGVLDEAEQLYRVSLGMKRAVHGEDAVHPSIAVSLHNLGGVMNGKGVLDEAEQLYRESLRMKRAVHGEDAVHPEIAASLNQLGGMMKGKGVLDEAEQLYRESLGMERAVHGEDAVHPSIASSLHNLGGVMKGKGVLDEAKQLCPESLRMKRAVHGEDAIHPEIATSLNQLGGVMESKRVLDEAEEL